MTEKTYTAADFAAAKFAEKDDYVGMRDEQDAGQPWTIKRIGGAYQSRCTDAEMANRLWTPVPARPTITESELRETIMGGSGFADAIRDGVTASLSRLGIEVVPDPVPTNAERLAALMYEADEKDHSSVPGGWEHVAEFPDRAGVTAPGGDDDH